MTKRELYWRAVYEDESILMQYETRNGKQFENKYPNINRDKLARFDLLDFMTNKPVYSLWIHEGQQLIYRRRTYLPVDKSRPVQVVYLVGYQHTVLTPSGARNFKVINYIYEDGSMALDDSRDNLELYSIEN